MIFVIFRTILCQAFDDCSGIQACFRLMEIFSGLLNRPIIKRHFEKKYFELLAMYSDDVQAVHKMFLRDQENPPMHPNMAPCMFHFAA
jgi:dynein heavy chain